MSPTRAGSIRKLNSTEAWPALMCTAHSPLVDEMGRSVNSRAPVYLQLERIMYRLIIIITVVLSIFATPAEARCHTHKCWRRVHIARAEHSVEKKITKITPYRCWTVVGLFKSARPCWIISQESGMVRAGPWWALNFSSRGTPCLSRACGPYQFLGWNVPWPVIVKSKYETLKRKLAHHRQARRLPLSAWGG